MGNKKKKIILWLLLAAWMALIFSFSAMAAPASDELSGGVAQKVIKIVAPGFGSFSGDEQAEFFYTINYGIRKIAHASEYAVLGILALLVLLSYKKTLRFQVLAALLLCAAYAASDEAHQILVSGRSPQVTDVLIDTAGAAIGIAILLLFRRLFIRRKQKKLANI